MMLQCGEEARRASDDAVRLRHEGRQACDAKRKRATNAFLHACAVSCLQAKSKRVTNARTL